jgi:hypothetical protein
VRYAGGSVGFSIVDADGERIPVSPGVVVTVERSRLDAMRRLNWVEV